MVAQNESTVVGKEIRMLRVNIRSIAGKDFPVAFADTTSVSGSQLKQALRDEYPEELAGSKLHLYAGGKRLKDGDTYGDLGSSVGRDAFISLVCSSLSSSKKSKKKTGLLKRHGEECDAGCAKGDSSNDDGRDLSVHSQGKGKPKGTTEYSQLFADIVGDYERSVSSAKASTSTPASASASVSVAGGTKAVPGPRSGKATKRRRLGTRSSIKELVSKLPLPTCLKGVTESFQELSVIVGFIYHQGLQPTLSGLQRFLPTFEEETLWMMAAFAPGVVTTRQVCSLPQFSDASKGKIGATHGALAETGMVYENTQPSPGATDTVASASASASALSADGPRSGGGRGQPTQESEIIINLHIPKHGTSPRVPMQNTMDSQKLEWKTLTGGMVYGGLVYSDVGSNQKMTSGADHDIESLPSLIQGSRSSSQTIGPVGLSNAKSYQKGKMAQAMKQDVLLWQSYFKQALLEVVLMLHEDFMKERGLENHDPLEKQCWHSQFSLDSFEVKSLMEFSKKNLARDFTLSKTKSAEKELKGTFKPCKCTTTMGVEQFVGHLIEKASAKEESRVAYLKEIPGRQAHSFNTPFLSLFGKQVTDALVDIGIKFLYTHQESAVVAVKDQKNVIITTPTASGKSICYNAPILDDLLKNPSTALYIFPTKALAQDQVRALRYFCKRFSNIDIHNEIGVYDGDTSQADRSKLMANGRLLICNPDILHVTMFPRHKEFSRFLSRLKYVVLDEAHAYRGVFGSHVSLVLRRLRRLLERVYNTSPQFFLSSATIANSVTHAQNLTGVFDWVEVRNDGSPCGDKTFLLWNPPLKQSAKRNQRKLLKLQDEQTHALKLRGGYHHHHHHHQQQQQEKIQSCSSHSTGTEGDQLRMNAWKGRQRQKRESRRADERLVQNGAVRTRLSPIMEMGMLFAECVQHNLKCIAFCKTRKLSELVLTYARDILDQMDSDRGKAIAAYRAGYSADHRRAIEGSLFNGNLIGVAATNALELGIDVGALDVTLHLGFPGTVSSLWQQAGRAGRREQKALSIYVAFDGALDQFFMKNPEKLFEAPIEHASIDYQNPMLLEQHIACACHEYPLLAEGEVNDIEYFGSTLGRAVIDLQKRSLLGRNPECSGDKRWFYIGNTRRGPASMVNLRAIDETAWTVIDDQTQEVVEEIEESKAFFQIYEGAVYMHQGKKFLCTNLDMNRRIAKVRRADLKYYTSIRQHTDIEVTGGKSAYPDRAILPSEASVNLDGSSAQLEHACHCVSFVGFMKVWHSTGQVFDVVDLNLPKVKYDTICSWIRIPDKARALVEQEHRELRAGVHAAAHALLNVLPLYLMCNVCDAGVECVNENETRWRPERLLIYDRQPGGTGISAQVQPLFGNILRAAYELVKQCPCEEECGCPNCVQHGDCPQYNAVLDKHAALIVLDAVLEAEGLYLGNLQQAEGEKRTAN